MLKIVVREFFDLPFLIGDFDCEDNYPKFLQNLSDYIEVLELKLSQEDQDYMIDKVEKYLHILIKQITTNKLSFIEKCEQAAPIFLKPVFTYRKLK
jgi:hypothetical protein